MQASQTSSALYLGLMSGTSLDGIDAALVDFSHSQPQLIAASCTPFDAPVRTALLDLQAPQSNELHRATLAANALAEAYAKASRDLLQQANVSSKVVAAIGMHGQTIRHQPQQGYTLQIGNAALLAERSGITVISDFRSRDVAAGGQGAPLVPAFHRALFASDETHRVIVNIGGIANITDLPLSGPVRGWDCGPGNVLLDGWIQRHLAKDYDADGAWAASGTPHPALLAALLAQPYFRAAPPKSTGRDWLDMAWLDTQLSAFQLSPADVQATLLEFTAQTIADSVLAEAAASHAIYTCGGGAHNSYLMQRLRSLLTPRHIASTQELGLHHDWVEACAFAWLAKQCLDGAPGNLPAVTGARGLRILGAIHQA